MEIYVEPKKLRSASPELDKLSQDISYIERLFSNCIRTLDEKVKSSAAVTRNMLFISEKLNNVERLLQEHNNYLTNSAERYKRTDGDKVSETGDLEYEFNDNRNSPGNTALENYIKENLPWLYDWWYEIRKYIDISNITGDWASGGFDFLCGVRLYDCIYSVYLYIISTHTLLAGCDPTYSKKTRTSSQGMDII